MSTDRPRKEPFLTKLERQLLKVLGPADVRRDEPTRPPRPQQEPLPEGDAEPSTLTTSHAPYAPDGYEVVGERGARYIRRKQPPA